MTYLEALIIAIVEGLTEFLPISSTGHMVLAEWIMGTKPTDFTKLFTVSIQLGAILSVVVLYFKRLFPDFANFNEQLKFYGYILLGCLPAALVGIALEDQIDAILLNPLIVAITITLGGVVLVFIDKFFLQNEDKPLSVPGALKIGLFQCISLIPGVSRSASSIIGGMTQGLTRKSAAEFSFFMAIPIMAGATLLKTYKYLKVNTFSAEEIKILAFGNVVAFLVALLAIKYFVEYLQKHGFFIFGVYRIVIGLILLGLYFSGVPFNLD